MRGKQKPVKYFSNFLNLRFFTFVQAIQHYKILAGMAQRSFKSANDACSIDVFLVECGKCNCRQIVY